MDKKDLVIRVAKRTGVSKTVARKAVDAFTDAIVVSAKRKGTIQLAGLGKVVVTSSKASKGRIEAKRRIKARKQSITLTPSKLLEWHVGSIADPGRSQTSIKAKSVACGRI